MPSWKCCTRNSVALAPDLPVRDNAFKHATPAILILAAGLGVASPVLATDAATESTAWKLTGDLRAGYAANWRNSRDGQDSSSDNFRARLRVRLAREFSDQWQFSGRISGSYASDQDGFDAFLRRYRPSGTGVNSGDTTVDEFYLRYTGINPDWQIRFGRFITGFNLPVVPGKSLDRNDASNFGIGWTDGVHLRIPVRTGWRMHLIGQANSPKGTGNTVRGPLDFTDRSSRASLYAALEATENPGPLTMRMLSLTWMPDTLAHEGADSPARRDYATLVARTAAAWPLGDSGMRLVAAGEIGHALNRPARRVLGLTGKKEVSGNAWQASLNLFDIHPGHHLGIVYGRVQPGWLISNDFRNNDELAEIRYQWRPSPNLSTEIRYRWRRELELPVDTNRPRRDRDIYARVTLRF